MSSIAKNTAFMTIASIAQKVISFVYFTLVARALGTEGTGQYVTALAFSTIFVVFIDLGFTNVLIREIAKYKERAQEYVSSLMSVKLLLSGLSYGMMMLVAMLLGYSDHITLLIALSGITMIFDSLHLTCYGVFRAMGNIRYEALAITLSQFATLVLGGVVLMTSKNPALLILAFTIPSCLNMLFAGTMLYKTYKIFPIPVWNSVVMKTLIPIAIPFAIAAIFARVYSYIDTILLSTLAGDVAVGLYSIPYKLTFAFQFIPLALVAAVYPRFSEYSIRDKTQLSYIFEQSIRYLLIIVFPIAIGISVLATPIITTFFTDAYIQSIPSLQILMAGLVFSFISFPIGAMLNACNKQKTQTAIIGVVMCINIILNVLLIPIYSIAGAAIAALIGNIILTSVGYFYVSKIVPVSHRHVLTMIARMVVATCCMAFVVYLVMNILPLVVAVGIGALVYIVGIFVTKAITWNDVLNIKTMLRI
jgi:O-antigen/teichoic acid export membrane protein